MINFILRPGNRFRNLIEITDSNENTIPERTYQLRLTMDKKTGEIYVVKFLLSFSIEKVDINNNRKFSIFALTSGAVKSRTLWTIGFIGKFTKRVNSIDFVDPLTVHEFIKELNVTTILRVPVIAANGPIGFQVIPEAEKELLENYTSIPDLTPGARYFYKDPSKPNI